MEKAHEVVLRMDDVGAATKLYEQYAKLPWSIAGERVPTPEVMNWGFLKRIPWWKGWGPYDELTAKQWGEILNILVARRAKLTVGVTAAWVENNGTLTPFNIKYSEQASLLRDGVSDGLIEIANHGLTHCVLEDKKFLPHFWRSNRMYHREFWEWLPENWHREHIMRSQQILQDIFKTDIVTFIPSGNYWTAVTEKHALAAGIKYISAIDSRIPADSAGGIQYLPEDSSVCFHDRELVLYGVNWLDKKISERHGQFKTVREYFESGGVDKCAL